MDYIGYIIAGVLFVVGLVVTWNSAYRMGHNAGIEHAVSAINEANDLFEGINWED